MLKNYFPAWFTAAFVAAVAYLLASMISTGSIYSPVALLNGFVLEMVLATIAVPFVAIPLLVILKWLQVSISWAISWFVLAGAIFGTIVFAYFAGGEIRHLILGGAFPGAMSGGAFIVTMLLTKQYRAAASAPNKL